MEPVPQPVLPALYGDVGISRLSIGRLQPTMPGAPELSSSLMSVEPLVPEQMQVPPGAPGFDVGPGECGYRGDGLEGGRPTGQSADPRPAADTRRSASVQTESHAVPEDDGAPRASRGRGRRSGRKKYSRRAGTAKSETVLHSERVPSRQLGQSPAVGYRHHPEPVASQMADLPPAAYFGDSAPSQPTTAPSSAPPGGYYAYASGPPSAWHASQAPSFAPPQQYPAMMPHAATTVETPHYYGAAVQLQPTSLTDDDPPQSYDCIYSYGGPHWGPSAPLPAAHAWGVAPHWQGTAAASGPPPASRERQMPGGGSAVAGGYGYSNDSYDLHALASGGRMW
eukprot:jgi/Tetstr1/456225/TSEL_042988.t1